jgi:hypothetical protein
VNTLTKDILRRAALLYEEQYPVEDLANPEIHPKLATVIRLAASNVSSFSRRKIVAEAVQAVYSLRRSSPLTGIIVNPYPNTAVLPTEVGKALLNAAAEGRSIRAEDVWPEPNQSCDPVKVKSNLPSIPVGAILHVEFPGTDTVFPNATRVNISFAQGAIYRGLGVMLPDGRVRPANETEINAHGQSQNHTEFDAALRQLLNLMNQQKNTNYEVFQAQMMLYPEHEWVSIQTHDGQIFSYDWSALPTELSNKLQQASRTMRVSPLEMVTVIP